MDEYENREVNAGASYDACRAQFAREVLLYAAFKTQQTKDRRKCSGDKTAKIEQDGDARSFELLGASNSSFIPFKQFNAESDPKLCSGIFCKEEFFVNACIGGHGLPFGVGYTDTEIANTLKVEKVEQEIEKYGYERFSKKLARMRESIPTELSEKIERFGTDELDWLTVFLGTKTGLDVSKRREHPARRKSKRKCRI